MMKTNKLANSHSDKIFDIINIFLMVILGCIFTYPLIFIISASISDPNAVWNGQVWLWPVNISWKGYYYIIKNNDIWLGYRNTIFYTVVGVAINLVLTICAAYPLSRKDFLPRNFFMAIFVFTMYFSGGMIPTYLVIKDLHMINTVWALLIPNAVSIFNIIITRTYFQTSIPPELQEAAYIDGCGTMTFLLKIVIPLSGPILAVMALFYGVGHWNDYFSALLYLNNKNIYPLQLFLRSILSQNQVNISMMGTDSVALAEKQKIGEAMKYGIIIVSTLPMLIIYPFIQKFFTKGMMIGALKG